MRRAVATVAALVGLVVTTGCAPTDDPSARPSAADGADAAEIAPIATTPQPALPVTVTSADGAEVTVESAARVIPLSGSLAETVFALGLGDHVVARDISTTFDEADDLPLVTRSHDVSAESVLSLSPTLVLAQTDTGPPEALDQIRAAGVPVVVFDLPMTIADTYTRIDGVAAALGLPGEGDALEARTRAAMEQAADAIPTDHQPPRVAFLYLRGSAGVYLLGGKGSGADSMIEAAGAVDAGTELGLDRAFTPLTSEALAAAAPDVILMTTTGLESVGGIEGLVQIPGVAQTPAGRDRRVITEEDGLLYSFGSRTPEALSRLISQLYAEA
jgi:iron complex transport system substrate-binding protein